MRTIRLSICVALMLLTFPQAGRAQDTFNSGGAPSTGAAGAKEPCYKERLGPHYAEDDPIHPGPCFGGGPLLPRSGADGAPDAKPAAGAPQHPGSVPSSEEDAYVRVFLEGFASCFVSTFLGPLQQIQTDFAIYEQFAGALLHGDAATAGR